uniref:hypothetical protein n=1 Tax=Pseudomonas sp. TaxID=306 RepID=UPI00159ED728|nr:hypothetical protein [Pseudomonas sp.]
MKLLFIDQKTLCFKAIGSRRPQRSARPGAVEKAKEGAAGGSRIDKKSGVPRPQNGLKGVAGGGKKYTLADEPKHKKGASMIKIIII